MSAMRFANRRRRCSLRHSAQPKGLSPSPSVRAGARRRREVFSLPRRHAARSTPDVATAERGREMVRCKVSIADSRRRARRNKTLAENAKAFGRHRAPQSLATLPNPNSGTISAAGPAIFVGGVLTGNGVSVVISTFSGGITNSGLLSGGTGILVGTRFPQTPSSLFALSTFTGGISNSGKITAHTTAILVENVANFSGGITNASGGTISNDGFVGAIEIERVTSFSGGIVNASGGLISARGSAIAVFANGTFAGGITNAGKLVAKLTQASASSRPRSSTAASPMVDRSPALSAFMSPAPPPLAQSIRAVKSSTAAR